MAKATSVGARTRLCFDNGIHGLRLRADASMPHLLVARFVDRPQRARRVLARLQADAPHRDRPALLRHARPPRVPVRVEVAGAAREVRLDDWWLDSTVGGMAEQTPGYATARTRYLVVVTGTADRLTIGTTGRSNE